MDEPTTREKIDECWFRIRNIETAINAWEHAVQKRSERSGDSVKLWLLRRERELILEEIKRLQDDDKPALLPSAATD